MIATVAPTYQTYQTLTLAGPEPTAPVEGEIGLPPRYEDRGQLGAGAMGEVRRVYDRVLHTCLAMKILRRGPQEADLTRFMREARVTARLHHPGVVAVQDIGCLADGRPWYTMEEVQGRTLAELLLLHRGGLRRPVELYARVCEIVAYAHAAGVVHRDLKPDNIMVGAFGEVRVMDWGLARVLDDAEPEQHVPESHAPEGTRLGAVLGTPGFMPPEQAEGRGLSAGPQADVYALGAVLYLILTGRRPYAPLTGLGALVATTKGPPISAANLAPDAPPPLLELCAQAMSPEPERRPPHAGRLAEALRDWLEGARKEAEATALAERALAQRAEVERLFVEAEASEAEAAALLDGVPAYAPVEQKLPGWRLEAQAEATRQNALRVEEDLLRGLRAALAQAPTLAEAHEALADLYRARLERAEARGELLAAADAEARLREHDRGRHAAWLRGDGALTLLTDPPGAAVTLYRYVERDRRLVETCERELGPTPLLELPLPRGSYLLRLSHPERAPVRYPVCVGRQEHWDGVRPGDDRPFPIVLPRILMDNDCYVPAGWFHSGGDREALDGLPSRRLWVDGLLVRRDPVTNVEYLAYLQALLSEGGDVEAALPRGLTADVELFRVRGDRVALGASEGRPLRPREPMVFLSPEQADRYVAWRAARDGLPWRLPHDQEWEKAARGVDARIYPWGDRFEPTWARMQSTLAGAPGRADVDETPGDVGPYGVRGMAGNVRDLCHNGYRRGGLPPAQRLVLPEPASADEPYRMLRGGSWAGAERQCRLATRVTTRPGVSLSVGGLRLVRTSDGSAR